MPEGGETASADLSPRPLVSGYLSRETLSAAITCALSAQTRQKDGGAARTSTDHGRRAPRRPARLVPSRSRSSIRSSWRARNRIGPGRLIDACVASVLAYEAAALIEEEPKREPMIAFT